MHETKETLAVFFIICSFIFGIVFSAILPFFLIGLLIGMLQ